MEKSSRASISSQDTAWSSQSTLRPHYFQYDVLSEGEIRIFKLELNGEEEPLSGTLLTTYHIWNSLDNGRLAWKHRLAEDVEAVLKQLTGREDYHTFSYTWGDQSETYPLYLTLTSGKLDSNKQVRTNFEPYRNGAISIGRNLKTLLEELRRRKHMEFVWIDAICINQANEMEKKMQIPMMRDIYEYAGDGYVWLGEATPDEVTAMNLLPHLTDQLREACLVSTMLSANNERTFTDLGLPSPSDRLWKAIGSIMRNPYWSRLWTLQEVVVPERSGESGHLYDFPPTQVLYGETTTPLEVFNQFAIAATALGIRSWIITGSTDLRPRSLYAFDGIDEIRTARESWGTDLWGVSLSALLMGTRRRKATIAVDAVFGMLAMMDHRTSRTLAPEANSSTRDVFVKFAKHYIRNELKENLLNHIATEERMEGLPSWCPNFASSPATISLGSRWVGRASLTDELKRQMYSAGFKLEGKWKLPKSKAFALKAVANVLSGRNQSNGLRDTKNPRQMALLPDSDNLLVAGIHMDEIVAVADCNAAAESANFFSLKSLMLTESWDTQCLQMSLQHLSRDVEGFDVYARTITANRVSMERSHSDTILFDREHQLNFVESYRKFKAFIQNMKSVQGEIHIEDKLDRETIHFADTLSRVTRQRRFFATGNGRIGLGPAETEVGDSLSILFYCPTPYVLRHQPNGRSRLVGEAYVHSLMYGEALDMLDRGEIHETKWVLE
ncbi:hypothetical protein H2198_009187 [Neophaeococcomyces mojaviensis]|uniref:Uncharacterized protein n=1 Tax=Neophaeococcomyces mojaviensis TaxID=3383035 RepID=A0ACC2ZVF2_9EURO|nr:hypothetical protein H2198_009187 [Knufia sp. JES_112]